MVYKPYFLGYSPVYPLRLLTEVKRCDTLIFRWLYARQMFPSDLFRKTFRDDCNNLYILLI